MNSATKTALTALLFAATIPAAVTTLNAQNTAPKRSKVVSATPGTEEERAAEDKARFQLEQDRVNEELYRQMASMKQDVLRETLNRMRRGGSPEVRNGDVGAFVGFVLILMAILWLVRTIMENRRWNRVAAIQTETHNKLLDRLASSQELMAYMESEAGRKFLQSAPFQIEGQSDAAPYGRILWSAQLGVIILMVGVAFLWLQGQVADHVQAMLVYGTLSLALGIGCILSAGFSFVLSKSLGLVHKPGTEQGQHPNG